MSNVCQFSPSRRYRYSLKHEIDGLPLVLEHPIMWIGLNPSTADENMLDPTLRRVRTFTMREGGTAFVMTNLFAWRDTDPKNMMAAADPVGPDNDATLLNFATRSEMIICAWGGGGEHRARAAEVIKLLKDYPLYCLGTNGDGSPRHPLYLSGATKLEAFTP